MKYLEYSELPAFIAAHFSGSEDSRRVGRLGQFLSDYIDTVRFFGPEGIRPSDVTVRCLNEPFVIPDQLIAEFAARTATIMRTEGRLYDGPLSMKPAACDFNSETPLLIVQPCDYALQAGSCFALDLPDKRFDHAGGTLRDYYRRGCLIPRLDNNPLATCLGVCGYLIVDERGDRFVLQVKRSSKLASLENTFGPSVAGVVDYSAAYRDLQQLIISSMAREAEEELGLQLQEYETIPLAWSIELFRGERPQIFCLIRTLLTREELTMRLQAIPVDRREFEAFEFIPLYGGTIIDQKHLDVLNPEAKMNFFLMEEYLSL
jgi:8-oxo-dGTP pyrophosphatase MutT (NUDIX family)